MDKKLIYEALRMLKERRDFYTHQRDNATFGETEYSAALYTATAYDSAVDILEHAINGDTQGLYQFDYFGAE